MKINSITTIADGITEISIDLSNDPDFAEPRTRKKLNNKNEAV